MLNYDKAQSNGAKTVLERAWRLSELDWTPKGTLAINERKYVERVLGNGAYTGKAFHGTPYASARVCDKFIGIDLKLRTFLSALENPFSALYNRDLGDFTDPAYRACIKNAYLFYGTVCSAFVNYSLNLPMHRSTHEWSSAPEFYALPEQCANALQLCDTLVTLRNENLSGGHVRLVTGLGRDENGNVQEVEISEGVPPLTIRKSYSAQEFEDTLWGHKGVYRIYRYRYLDDVQDTEGDLSLSATPLMLNYGQDANYRFGETVNFAVPASVADGTMKLVNTTTGEENTCSVCTWETKAAAGESYRVFALENLPAGDYKAFLSGYEEPICFQILKPFTVRYSRQDGTKLVRRPYTLCAPDGSALTAETPALYEESGELKKETTLAIRTESRIIPIPVALRCLDGKICIRPIALFHDADGNRIALIPIDNIPTLYAAAAKEHEILQADLSDGIGCVPLYWSWKDQAYASYSQKMLTGAEIAHGHFLTKVEKHDSDLTHIMVFCKNSFGRISTEPELVVID